MRLHVGLVLSCALLLSSMPLPPAAASPLRVRVTRQPQVVRRLIADKKVSFKRSANKRFARKIAKTLPLSAENYKQVVLDSKFVLAERLDGVMEIYPRALVANMMKSNENGASLGKRQVGTGAMGYPLFAENGPEGTTALYRQISRAGEGEIASTQSNTSFALRKADAMHPFGKAGRTVRLVVPNAIFEDAVEGRAGAVGWNNLGNGYSMGIDVVEEIQIPSERIRTNQP